MIKNPPLVSVIMNCYNGGEYLYEAINSIYNQSYKNWEIVFWDNASTDNSAEIARSYDNRVRYFLAEDTTLLGEARNLALQKASGKYVAFLDCDDLYLSDKLERQVQLMELSSYAMCYGSVITIDKKGLEIRRNTVKNHSGYIFGQLLKHYEINMQSVLVRRSVLIKDRFNFITHLRYCPDYNLFMLISSKYKVGVLPDYLAQYRVLKNSLSSKMIDVASSEIRFTLDEITRKNPEFKKKYSLELMQAYAKAKYYDVIACIFKGDRYSAIIKLKPILLVRYEYPIIFLLLLIQIPLKLILRILNR
jgi:glycosyltransferase involved in cell wall biosynthesis